MLVCGNEHEFESWFSSSGDYEALREKTLLECPHCGSRDVRKALMSPNISVGAGGKKDAGSGEDMHDSSQPSPPPAPAEERQLAPASSITPEMLDAARELRRHIDKHSEYVGDRFAEEARKIHYEETEARLIHGEASLEEARELAEEGVEFLPLPELPEDKN
jgi:hypothetical protein